MKKIVFFLAAIWIPMIVWSQKPTHTLTFESKKGFIHVFLNNTETTITGEIVRWDTVFIENYQLEEGETYRIVLSDGVFVQYDNNLRAGDNSYYTFVEWLLDGVSYSTSPNIWLTMGTSDMHLATVLELHTEMPYSPVANWFEPTTGVLTLDEVRNNAIGNAIIMSNKRYKFERDDVVSIVVKGYTGNLRFSYFDVYLDGEFNSSGGAGFIPWNNLQMIDMSQTDMKSVGDGEYMYAPRILPALEHIVLGPNTQKIGIRAFYRLNINTIDCYAVTPPSCIAGGEHDASFADMKVPVDQVLIRVPPQSVELYKQADGWKDFPNIQPLTEVANVSVKLPTNVPEGYYEDMTVELHNLRSELGQSRNVLNKREFMFYSQMRNFEYQAVLKNAYGQVMGQSDPVELGEDDITLTISDLLRKKDVSLKVTAPDGTDVTGKVRVMWTDESGKTLGYASTLKAAAEGSKLSCEVILTGELARQYVSPGAVPVTVNGEGENLLTVGLQLLQPLTLHGQVKDQQTGEGISGATVALMQQQAGNLNKFVTATTDTDGKYELLGTNGAGELSVTAIGYLPATAEYAAPEADGALPSVVLEPFNGVIVNTWLTYTEAAKEGEVGNVTDNYDDENGDITYQVYNLSKNAFVNDFLRRGKALYLPTGAEAGHLLMIVASSRTKSFSDVSEVCQVGNDGLGYVTLSIMQQGGIEAVAETAETDDGSAPIMGILYDSDGKFVRSNRYKFGTLSFSDLASGYYTLVSMTYNDLMGRVLMLSTLDDMGLVDGTDYVKNELIVQDGRIATVNVTNVPVLDEKKISFTGSGTYFVADKNMISAGQYITIRSKLSFAEQYAARTGNVELVLDLPEGTELVEYSAMIGTTPCNYWKENGHYILSRDNNLSDLFRLCVSTTQPGAFNISGSVRFTLDGVQMVQPVGTVWVQANGVTINEPGFTPPSTLHVSGTAPLICKSVEIYDNDRMVGRALVNSNGIWSASIQIPDAVSRHAVKARMATLENGEAVGESETRYFDRTLAKKVVMMPPHSQEPVTFDYFENTVSPRAYTFVLPSWWKSWWQGDWMAETAYSTKFTFLAVFNDQDLPKEDETVQIKVLASDGTTRTLDAKYNENMHGYYASSSYTNASKIPVSAYAYTYKNMYGANEATLGETIKKMLTEADKVAVTAAEKGEVELLPDDGETLRATYTVSGKLPLELAVKEIDYDAAAERVMDNMPFMYRNEKDTIVGAFVNGTDEAEMLLLDVKRHVAMQTIITYAGTNGLGAMPGKKGAATIKKKPSPTDVAKIWAKGANVGDAALNIFGLKGYADFLFGMTDISYQHDSVYMPMIRKSEAIMDFVINSKCCQEGKCRRVFSHDRFIYYQTQVKIIQNNYDEFFFDKRKETSDKMFYNTIQKLVWDAALLGGTQSIAKGAKAGYKAAEKIVTKLDETVLETDKFVKAFDEAAINTLVLEKDGFLAGIDKFINYDFNYIYEEFDEEQKRVGRSTLRALDNLKEEAEKERDRKCPSDKPDDDDDDDDTNIDDDNSNNSNRHPFPTPVSPLIDPQGYVYEAVPSNRVEGATAVIYYKGSGDTDVMWDAENYGQVNPQITKADGMYQWDVPQGQWQVRVQKEGYENNASEWLPVPPPQLDVNIPLIRARLPKVESAHAYKDAVAVKFDTYMQPSLLTTEQITVKENGSDVAGTIELTDEEEAQAGVSYASRLRFVPATPFTANEVTLLVSGEVKSYAGIEMEPYEAVLKIEGEVKSLEAESILKIDYQGTGLIHLKGTPAAAAAGKKVTVKCQSGIIASIAQAEVVLDANGEADVTVQGNLPGNEIVTFTMADPGLTAGTLVKVVQKTGFVVNAPMASVATETMVEIGTGITLTCSTEDAVIYFTLDGSSPVDSETRILYTGSPVVIYEETSLAAVAVVEGKGMSEVVVFHYTVPMTTQINDVQGSSIAVSPVRVQDAFAVTGVDGTFCVSVYSMSGQLQMRLEQVNNGRKVNATALQTGVYLVVVNGENAYFTQRIIKE